MTQQRQLNVRGAFPRELAALIAAKASRMAQEFEDRAIEQMVRDAKRAIGMGVSADQIARELGLTQGG
ncbi:hypothetical protein [uncultured Pseudomonas sp.]|uniref:hypothetical protein n=1 Tax=uncultured Pseudomonas sp. TaxID=114707 RepID=UPI0025F06FD6|nr:hypothetical protein [uncultured Pseudomonas sp.]